MNFYNMAKILISSIDAPYIGGAGTNAYNIIKMLRKLGHQVAGLFFYKDMILNKDPHNIGGIWRYAPEDNMELIKNNIINYLGGEPIVIFAKNYIGVLMSNKFFPNAKLIFLPSGSQYYSHYSNKFGWAPITNLLHNLKIDKCNLTTIVNKQGKGPCWPSSCPIGCNCEQEAYKRANIIIPNSDLSQELFSLLFGSDKISKFVETSAIYDIDTIPKILPKFETRKFDIMFGCYSWNREIKNLNLVGQILTHPKLKNKKVLVAGDGANKLKISSPNIIIKQNKDIPKMLDEIKNAKTYVCTSYYDSYPNMINEADYCGCNLITSRNVGQRNKMPAQCIINNYTDLDEWVTKILASLNIKYAGLEINQDIILLELLERAGLVEQDKI